MMNGQKIVKCEECMPACKINTRTVPYILRTNMKKIFSKNLHDSINTDSYNRLLCIFYHKRRY